jgi:hypothetical protein
VSAVRERLARVLDAHFDPRWGSPFWLGRRAELGFDPRREIAGPADLPRLGAVDLGLLASRPVEHFVPRRFHERLSEFVVSETGGTTGPPRRTVFRRDEFAEAFVHPFAEAAARLGFPRGRHWLFLGPSGPHVIGKAARACAAALGSLDPFCVDLDPRWLRALAPGSLARRRYLEHVLAQADAVLASQEVGVLFATPPLLAALAERLDAKRREAIEGIHWGGVAAEPGFWPTLRPAFPNARVMGGYGNSLAGVCPQLGEGPGGEPDYHPHGARLLLDVAEPTADGRGRVRFHRLDESALLVNVVERDVAIALPPPAAERASGFGAGLRDPRPPADAPTAEREAVY